MKKVLNFKWLLALVIVATQLVSCGKDDPIEVIAGFSYTVDPVDFRKVTFTNASTNFSSVEWDFGDNSTKTKAENPVHTYATIGTYTVTLTATASDGGTDVHTQTIVLTDPNAELTKLVGDVSKTWKLIRQVGNGVWPLEVGPADKSTIWWAQGKDNDELANRPCIMNDEWEFTRAGAMVYRSNGDYWAEGGGLFSPDNICASTSSMVGPNGEDRSAWGDGTHAFTYTGGKLTVTGLGAWIGLPKIGTGKEVKEPQTSVEFQVTKLVDGPVDTLVLEEGYDWSGDNVADGYWKITLVHYDNPADEPGIPAHQPASAFTYNANLLTVNFTNTGQYGTSWSWDFGDGATATTQDATHTFAASGVYTVKLTTTNSQGSAVSTQEIFINATALTAADLQGAAWKCRPTVNSIFVGPAIGSNAWWGVPANFLDGSTAGNDDWSCIVDDEFIFSAGGVFEYKTNGTARNDGYFGTPNGCWSDAQIAASPGAPFGSHIHSFTFTPGSGSTRPIITLTNGAGGAAFLGFYKGYYGGENTDNTKPANGGNADNPYEVVGYAKTATKEYLFISVDISDVHDGSRAWSAVLVR